MKALDIKLMVSRLLTETQLKMDSHHRNAEKALLNDRLADFEVHSKKACRLKGAYDAYTRVLLMFLDCDEINEQLEAEANAEKEEN